MQDLIDIVSGSPPQVLSAIASALVVCGTYAWRVYGRKAGQARTSLTFDTTDGSRQACTPFLRAVARFSAEARSRCEGAPLERHPESRYRANMLVANRIVGQIMEAHSVRHVDRVRIAPLVVASLFVPTRSEVEARALLCTPYVSERVSAYNNPSSLRTRRGKHNHRALRGYHKLEWEEEDCSQESGDRQETPPHSGAPGGSGPSGPEGPPCPPPSRATSGATSSESLVEAVAVRGTVAPPGPAGE